MKRYYDNTKLGDYKKCPRYYYLRHVKGWRPSGTAMPLIFGLCWHESMDIVWTAWEKVKQGKISKRDLVEGAMIAFEKKWLEEKQKPFDQLTIQDFETLGARTPMIAKEMLLSYIELRQPILDSMELVAAERPFAVPLYPDRDDIWYIGRRDKDIKLDGDRIVIEHKTTSEYKVDGGFKTQYIQSYYPNSQVVGYLYASKLEYGETRYCWVDAALVHKKVHDAFKFIPISATFATMDAWLWEARDWADRIESELERLEGAESGKIMTAFPKNTEQCCGRYGLCSMQSICRGFDNPAQLQEPPSGYIYEPWNPFEILHIASLGLKHDE